MMKTIELPIEKMHVGNLILVNAAYGLREDCGHLKKEVENFLQMTLEKVVGSDEILLVSGHRSAKEQAGIYETSMRNHGAEYTRKFVALPYHSEHQTGLAVDMGLRQDKIDVICPAFPYEGVCENFRRKAPQYGFVERYPQGKEHITGIAHEPWHFRYVGYPHAQIMTERHLTLEEYLEFIKSYLYDGDHLTVQCHSKQMEVYYVPLITKNGMEKENQSAKDNNRATLWVPDNDFYQVSGNNVDGFVVTVWGNEYES